MRGIILCQVAIIQTQGLHLLKEKSLLRVTIETALLEGIFKTVAKVKVMFYVVLAGLVQMEADFILNLD